MFQASPGQRFWADARTIRTGTADSRKARRFHRILDEEYLKVVTLVRPPPTNSEENLLAV
jgi:hypothetical protein